MMIEKITLELIKPVTAVPVTGFHCACGQAEMSDYLSATHRCWLAVVKHRAREIALRQSV